MSTFGSTTLAHLPEFTHILCGEMTDRERLGLPEHFHECELLTLVSHYTKAFMGKEAQELLHIVKNPARNLAERIACGDLLGIVGDPRIDAFSPSMIDIPSSRVRVGIDVVEIDSVMKRFFNLGLDRKWIEKETPSYEKTLPAYRIAKYPVTNQEYRVFLELTKHSEIPSSWHFRQFPYARANHPVYTVSPESADAYAEWLSAVTHRNFRLPSEEEWEWAASGPSQPEFPWGSEFDHTLANTVESGLFRSSAVGVFLGGESYFGNCDMAGNVEEYVSSDYAPYDGGSHIRDHLVEIHGNYRVARGGSFARFRDLARVKRRHGYNPKSTTYAMGFRLAESI